MEAGLEGRGQEVVSRPTCRIWWAWVKEAGHRQGAGRRAPLNNRLRERVKVKVSYYA